MVLFLLFNSLFWGDKNQENKLHWQWQQWSTICIQLGSTNTKMGHAFKSKFQVQSSSMQYVWKRREKEMEEGKRRAETRSIIDYSYTDRYDAEALFGLQPSSLTHNWFRNQGGTEYVMEHSPESILIFFHSVWTENVLFC